MILHWQKMIAAFCAVVLSTEVQVSPAGSPHRVTVEQHDDKATVLVDGELFTEYLTKSNTRPILWPVIGPAGDAMTRSYPVGERLEHEEIDHYHHRSVWFGYEGFNGVDYWHEHKTSELPVDRQAREQHVEFLDVSSDGDVGVIETRNLYLDENGEPVCSDERRFEFGAEDDCRWIDALFKLIASHGPLVVGDSKEGLFAVRVPGTMKVDAGMGGRIVNNHGQTNTGTWGKKAHWVDYYGPVNGKTQGIAMLVHPDSYNPEPRWHVRNYGLFGVNPFGEAPFTHRSASSATGGPELAPGESLALRYRIILHKGDAQDAGIQALYEEYTQE